MSAEITEAVYSKYFLSLVYNHVKLSKVLQIWNLVFVAQGNSEFGIWEGEFPWNLPRHTFSHPFLLIFVIIFTNSLEASRKTFIVGYYAVQNQAYQDNIT